MQPEEFTICCFDVDCYRPRDSPACSRLGRPHDQRKHLRGRDRYVKTHEQLHRLDTLKEEQRAGEEENRIHVDVGSLLASVIAVIAATRCSGVAFTVSPDDFSLLAVDPDQPTLHVAVLSMGHPSMPLPRPRP